MKDGGFRSWLLGADEVLRLPRRAAVLFAQRPPETFATLSEVLKEVLPRDAKAEEQLARALHASVDVLRGLSKRDRDPLSVEPALLISVARLLSLNWDQFERLVQGDHNWYVRTLGMLLRQAPSSGDTASAQATLRTAWERALLDDPSSVD